MEHTSDIPFDQRTPMPQTKKYVKPDGTIMYLRDGKLHNSEGPALIPEGNNKKREYYLYGIPYTEKEFKQVKKDGTGLPWFKTKRG
jgi:hypothetical protein